MTFGTCAKYCMMKGIGLVIPGKILILEKPTNLINVIVIDDLKLNL